jgi:hypothetical protein
MADTAHAGDVGPELCFVIGFPRSGTTVFKEMLATHPAVVSMGEIFNEGNGNSYWNYLVREIRSDPEIILPRRSVSAFLAYLESLRQTCRERNPQVRILVLDVKYSQSHFVYDAWRHDITAMPKVFQLMREKGWRVIDIHRRDLLASVVSDTLAITSGVYHSTSLAEGAQHRPKARLDVVVLERAIDVRKRAFLRMNEVFSNYPKCLNVIYEEMFVDQNGSRFKDSLLATISTFLGIPNAFDPRPRLTKLLPGDI